MEGFVYNGKWRNRWMVVALEKEKEACIGRCARRQVIR